MRRMSACRQLLIGMSIRRYLPPMGTAGFDRCWVSGNSRVPRPPPSTRARTSLFTLVFVPDVLAVDHVDHFFADVRGMVRDPLQRSRDEDQVHAAAQATVVVRGVFEQIAERLVVELIDFV